MLFDNIVNSSWFERTAVILFLNKMDLFRVKVESGQSPIVNSFADFKGAPTDVKAGQEYFASRFKMLVRNPRKETYIHYTNATDTDLLKKTMASVQDMIVQRNLNELIL
jgi:guanine nucleotide-binding protein subunit alpha